MPLLTCLGVDVVFVLGAALLIALVLWWRPAVSLRAAALYGALVTAFFAGPLLTGGLQVPTDIAYQTHPWRGTAGGKVRPLNPLLSDIVLEELPFHTLVRERLLRFEAPLWSHELGTGQPLLANARLRLFWILAVALAAGLTLESLPADRRVRIYTLTLLPIAGLALALVQPPPGAPWQRAWWVSALASAAAALAAVTFPRLRAPQRRLSRLPRPAGRAPGPSRLPAGRLERGAVPLRRRSARQRRLRSCVAAGVEARRPGSGGDLMHGAEGGRFGAFGSDRGRRELRPGAVARRGRALLEHPLETVEGAVEAARQRAPGLGQTQLG
jgi:hypothetical protein